MNQQSMVILSFPRIDIGNVAANLASIVVPCKMILDKLVVAPFSPAANSFSIRVDTLVANTRSNNAVGTVVVPDSAGAGAGYYNISLRGLVVNAGSILSLECTEAGDSGENACVSVYGELAPETEANQSNLTAG